MLDEFLLMDNLRPYAPGTTSYRRLLVAMFCAGLATFAQLYAPQSVLPSLAADMGISADSAALSVSMATAGLAVSALAWSYIADRWGRARTMLCALSFATGLGLLVPFVCPYPLLLAVRFVEGAFLAGIAGVAVAYIVTVTAAQARTAATGIFIAGTSLGGLAGRLLSGFVAEFFSWHLALATVSLMSAGACLIFWLLLPREDDALASASSLDTVYRAILGHLARPALLAIYGAAFLLMGSFVSVYNYVTFRLESPPFNLPVAFVSALFCAYLLGTFSSASAGRLARRYGVLPIFLGAVGVTVCGMFLTVLDSLLWVVIGLALLTAGFFAAHALASAQVGIIAVSARTQATALYNLFYYAGSAVLGWLMGFVYSGLDWSAVACICVVVTLSAGLLVLVGVRVSDSR